MRTGALLALLACMVHSSAAWAFTGVTPMIRSTSSPVSRTGALTICMGRKPATVGKGAPAREKKSRERTNKGVGAIVRVKKVAGDMCKRVLESRIAAATKDTFNAQIFSDAKVKSFMVEEAGSSMYPKLMKEIKFTAKKLGVSIPDRWAYEARGNSYQREKLAEKKAAKEAAAAAPAEAA